LCNVNRESVSTRFCSSQNSATTLEVAGGATQVEPCNAFMCNQWSSWSSDSFYCVPSCGPVGTLGRRVFYRTCDEETSRAQRRVQVRNEPEECSSFPQFGTCELQSCPTPDLTTSERNSVATPPLPLPSFLPTTTSATTATQALDFRPTSSVFFSIRPTTQTFRPSSTQRPALSSLIRPNLVVFWTAWTPCSATCGPGFSTRFPVCFRK